MRIVIRVELHKASGEDYIALHKTMLDEKYFRIIQDHNNRWYDMPTGLYWGFYNGEDLMGLAFKIKNLASKHSHGGSLSPFVFIAPYVNAAFILNENSALNK